MTYRAVKYRYCLSERLVLDARKLLRRALCYVQKGRTELNWARMGYSDWHLLITRLWKTAIVGLRLHRLKSNCPPGNQPGFVTNRSIEVYLRKILQSSSNFGWKKYVTVNRAEFLPYSNAQFRILRQDAACPTRVFFWFFVAPSWDMHGQCDPHPSPFIIRYSPFDEPEQFIR